MKSLNTLRSGLIIGAAIGVSVIASTFVFADADTTPPSVPAGLVATPISPIQVNLSWISATDNVAVTGYGIFRNGTQVATTTVNSYADMSLSASTSYTYTVDAFDAAGNLSVQSSSTVAATPLDTSAPSVPTSLLATAVSASQINLSWNTSTDNVAVTHYRIFRNGSQVATTTATSYSDTGLSASTNYSYTVAADDAAGNASAQSGSSSATTFAAAADTTVPSVPTGLSASAVSASQINLSWTAATDNVGVTSYVIYRGGTQIATTGATSYSDSGLTASTAYSYTVASRDAASNTSAQSASAGATTLAVSVGTTTPPATQHFAPPMIQVDGNGHIIVRGLVVTGVGTNTFTGTVWGVTYTVNYSTSTPNHRFDFLLRGGNSAVIDPAQIKVGDEVGVVGAVTASAPTTIQAQVVRNYSIVIARPPKPNKENDGDKNDNNNGKKEEHSAAKGIQNAIKSLFGKIKGFGKGGNENH